MKKLMEGFKVNMEKIMEQEAEAEAAPEDTGGVDPREAFRTAQYEKYVTWLGKNAKDLKVQKFLNYGLSKYDGDQGDDAFAIKKVAIPVVKLRPTQNEVGIEGSLKWPLKKNIAQFIEYAGATEPVMPPSADGKEPIVTFDGQWVIDGHHRWSTLYACNAKASIVCYNITANFELGPLGALKAVQTAIAKDIGKVPVESASGANLLKAGEEVVKGWIKQNADPKLIPLIKKNPAVNAKVFGTEEQTVAEGLADYIPGTSANKMKKAMDSGEFSEESNEAIAQIANYIWGNVSVMQKSAKPAEGAPKRGFMPQTGNAPNWEKELTSGEIDFAQPYSKVAESKKITISQLKRIIKEELKKATRKK